MGNYTPGIPQALEHSIDKYWQSRRYANEEYDRGIQHQRQQRADQRAEEAYQYGIQRRPLQEQMDQNTLDTQGIQKQNAKMTQDQLRTTLEKEGTITALRYLFAGMPDDAMKVYNRQGEGRINSIEPDPENEGVWIVKGADGKTYPINPGVALEKLGELKPKDDKNSLRGSDLIPIIDENGNEIYQSPGGAIGKRVPPSVRSGRSGSVPAILQETDAVFKRLKKTNPNANEAKLWLKAHELASQKSSSSEREAAQKFYSGIFNKLLPDDPFPEDIEKAKASAEKMTKDFIDKYYGDVDTLVGRDGGIPGPGGDAGGMGIGIQGQDGGMGGGGNGLEIGTVIDGYRYNGGNPNDARSWESVR